MHENNLFHGDLRPELIMICPKGNYSDEVLDKHKLIPEHDKSDNTKKHPTGKVYHCNKLQSEWVYGNQSEDPIELIMKINDFGQIRDDNGFQESKTVYGTYGFRPFYDRTQNDMRSDIYAIGGIMFWLMTN